jgi:predicted HicB family RNase H-like nuclease
MAKYTEAQARAVKKYLDNIGETKVRAPKEDMQRYKLEAEKAGCSLNQFIIEAIEEKIARANGYH